MPRPVVPTKPPPSSFFLWWRQNQVRFFGHDHLTGVAAFGEGFKFHHETTTGR